MLHIRINLSAFISPAWGNCKNRFMRFYGNNKNFVLHHTPTAKAVGDFQSTQPGLNYCNTFDCFYPRCRCHGLTEWPFLWSVPTPSFNIALVEGGGSYPCTRFLITQKRLQFVFNSILLLGAVMTRCYLLVYLVLHRLILQYFTSRWGSVIFVFFCGYLIAWQSCQPTLCAMHKHCKSIYSLTALDWRLVLKPETFTDALIHFRGRQQNHLLAVNLL